MEYADIYFKRLNRYGDDYKSRVNNQRKKEFENLLNKSVNRLDFEFNGEMQPGILNSKSQDETKTIQDLLVRKNLDLPNGTILNLNDTTWMVYWLEEDANSGYNTYTMLKMTHFIKWRGRDKQEYTTWGYLYGQEDNMLKNELKSRSRSNAVYMENLKGSFIVCPVNSKFNKGDYFEIGEGELKEGYTVVGYDRQSTPGVEYITIDPVYVRDNHEKSAPGTGESYDNPNYFWLQGGNS